MASKLRKITVSFFLSLVVAVIGLFLLPYTINWSDYKKEVEKGFKEATGKDISINGDISFTPFPYPHIEVTNITIKDSAEEEQDILKAPYIKATPALLSLLTGSVSLSAAELKDPVIRLVKYQTYAPNWKNEAAESAPSTKKKGNIFAGGFTFSVINAEVIFISGKKEEPKEKRFIVDNAFVMASSPVGPFFTKGLLSPKVAGEKLSQKISYDIEVENLVKKGGSGVSVFAISDSSVFAFKGILEGWGAKPVLRGRLDATLDSSFYSYAKEIDKKHIIPKFAVSLFGNDNTKIDADFRFSEEELSFKNLNIASGPKSKEILKAKGDIITTFRGEGKTDKLEVNIKSEYADFDSLLDEELKTKAKNRAASISKRAVVFKKKLKNNTEEAKASLLGLIDSVPDDKDIIVNLEIEKLILNGGTVKGFVVETETFKGKTLVQSLRAESMPGDVAFEIFGEVSKSTDTGNIKNFNGDVTATGKDMIALMRWLDIDTSKLKEESLKDFSLETILYLSQKRINLQRLRGGVDDTKFLGQALFVKNKGMVANAAVNFSKIDISKYIKEEVIEKKEEEEKIDTVAEHDINSVLSTFDFLRDINRYFEKFALSVAAKKISVKEKEFDDFRASALFGSGYLQVQEMAITSPHTGEVRVSAKLDTRQLKPYVDIALHLDKVDTKTISEILYFDKPKEKEDKKEGEVKSKWSEDDLDFKILSIFSGKIVFSTKEFIHNGLNVSDFDSEFYIVGDELKIQNIKAKAFDSNITANGSIGISKPSANVSFSASNTDVREIMRAVFGFENIAAGRASLSGGISTRGDNLRDWFRAMKGTGNFVARGLDIRGFNMGTITKRLYDLTNLKEVRYWAHKATSEGKTPVHYISGNVNIDKGILSMQNVAFNSYDITSAYINANIDLPEWTIDSKIKMNVKMMKEDIPITVTTSGSIDKPLIYWDKSKVDKYWESHVKVGAGGR